MGVGAALFILPIVSLGLKSQAGIAPVSSPQQPQANVVPLITTHETESSATAEMFLPDPSRPSVSLNSDSTPQITIPQLPADLTATPASAKDNANAIPLPPAVQSGLTGLAALGLAGGLRRLRRAFR